MAAYTAVTPADSRVNSSARLMMTSMSNSRRRRIAIVMATGTARYTRNGVMAYGTCCSGLFAWPNAMARPPTTWVASTPAMASPSHFICWRSRWSPRRYRSASDTSATGQQQRDHHGQAAQGAEPGDRPEGPDRQRVGIDQRDAARRGQRHPPRADHERGQAQAGQHQAGQRGRTPPGRGQPPGREDQEERGQVDGDEHEDRLGQRPGRGRRRKRSGVRLHAEDRVGRAGRHDGVGGPLGQHEPAHEVARPAHDQRAQRRVRDRPGHGADVADRVGRGQGAPLQRRQHEPGQRDQHGRGQRGADGPGRRPTPWARGLQLEWLGRGGRSAGGRGLHGVASAGERTGAVT